MSDLHDRWSGLNNIDNHCIAIIDDDKNIMTVNSKGNNEDIVFSMLTTDKDGNENMKSVLLNELQVNELFNWIKHQNGKF